MFNPSSFIISQVLFINVNICNDFDRINNLINNVIDNTMRRVRSVRMQDEARLGKMTLSI